MRVIVVGGGPAGMMAAGTAAENGHQVTLLERNDRPGRKLYLTGKGRCNVTNDSTAEEHMAQVNTNGKFLYSALSRFGSREVMRFFEENGVPLKTERGRRVFPQSDRSGDIVQALVRFMQSRGVKTEMHCRALSLKTVQNRICGVQTSQGFRGAERVILATGGLSYPITGATGDGYRLAQALGHTITPLYPALTAIKAAESWITHLEGLSLKNIRITVVLPGRKKPLYEAQGEMLFTREGVSGPVILSASRYIADKLGKHPLLYVDLKPAMTHSLLDERIQRDFKDRANKNFAHALDGLLPKRLIDTVIALSGISPNQKVNAITRAARLRLGSVLKQMTITPVGVGGYEEAVITMGGVNVREIDPSTLGSKKAPGLYFAGEILDIDAMTGGYNLQIAFSTGYLAGKSV